MEDSNVGGEVKRRKNIYKCVNVLNQCQTMCVGSGLNDQPIIQKGSVKTDHKIRQTLQDVSLYSSSVYRSL